MSSSSAENQSSCKTCKKTIPAGGREAHLSTSAHLKKVKWTCPECNRTMATKRREKHLSDPNHASLLPWTCTICKKTTTIGLKQSHLSNKAHLQNIPWTCTACSVTMDITNRESHLTGKPHAQALGVVSQVPPYRYKGGRPGALGQKELWICFACDINKPMDFNDWHKHLCSESHILKSDTGTMEFNPAIGATPNKENPEGPREYRYNTRGNTASQAVGEHATIYGQRSTIYPPTPPQSPTSYRARAPFSNEAAQYSTYTIAPKQTPPKPTKTRDPKPKLPLSPIYQPYQTWSTYDFATGELEPWEKQLRERSKQSVNTELTYRTPTGRSSWDQAYIAKHSYRPQLELSPQTPRKKPRQPHVGHLGDEWNPSLANRLQGAWCEERIQRISLRQDRKPVLWRKEQQTKQKRYLKGGKPRTWPQYVIGSQPEVS